METRNKSDNGKKEKGQKKDKSKPKKTTEATAEKVTATEEAADDVSHITDLIRLLFSPTKFKAAYQILEIPIRTKLVGIISTVSIVSLFVITYIAIQTFEADTINRTYSSNLQTTKLLSEKIETGFLSRIDQVKLMFGIYERAGYKGAGEARRSVIKQFFSGETDLLFAAQLEGAISGDDVLVDMKADFYDSSSLNRAGVRVSAIRKNILEMRQEMSMAFRGFTVVKNISPYYNMPILCIITPNIDSENYTSQIQVILIRMEEMLAAFEPRGYRKIVMIDNDGFVIGHYDNTAVMNLENIGNHEEVKRILEQTSPNGTFRYVDKEQEAQFAAFQRIATGNLIVIAQVAENIALEASKNVQVRSGLITAIVLILVITLLYFFAKTISEPLKRLVLASNEIKKGNYLQFIEATTRDEVGHLSRSFNLMSQGLEEREKLKGALNKFVNPEIAEQAMKGEIQLGGERKQATIFFSDIRSFTKISESLEPEEVVEFLNEYMTVMVDCINKTNGVVDKFIGDAIMAVWGVPSSKGHDEENAINGTLMMRKSLIEFNKGRGGPKKPIIKIGSGLNSGPVLAGQIGSDDRLEYTVIGDAVNLASRIEALNKPFGTDILISEETHSRVEGIFKCEPMQKIKVKGKSEPQQIYAVLGRMDDPTAPQTLKEMRDLVGIEFSEPEKGVASEEEEVKYEILE